MGWQPSRPQTRLQPVHLLHRRWPRLGSEWYVTFWKRFFYLQFLVLEVFNEHPSGLDAVPGRLYSFLGGPFSLWHIGLMPVLAVLVCTCACLSGLNTSRQLKGALRLVVCPCHELIGPAMSDVCPHVDCRAASCLRQRASGSTRLYRLGPVTRPSYSGLIVV